MQYFINRIDISSQNRELKNKKGSNLTEYNNENI